MHNQVLGRQGIRATCYANSETRPLVSPARRHARRKAANGAGRSVFAHGQSIPASPVTAKARPHFCVRSSSAVRPLYMGYCHDRAKSQVETQLQTVGAFDCPSVHAVFQLVSIPTPKGVGPLTLVFAPMHNISFVWDRPKCCAFFPAPQLIR